MRAKGEGSVFKRSDGKWVARVELPADPDTGRRRRAKRVRSSKQSAYTALAKLRREMGLPAAAEDLKVGEWVATWLVDCAERVRAGTMSPTTAVGYETKCRLHIVPQLGHLRLDKVTAGDVRRMMTTMRAAGLSATSAANARRTLSACLSAAIEDGLIDKNVTVAVRPEDLPPANPSAFSEAELEAILEACHEHRLGDLVVLAVLTGMRTSELIGLKWDDLDLDAGVYTVTEGVHRISKTAVKGLGLDDGHLVTAKPKTSGSGRATPLSAAAVSVLQRHRKRQAAEQLAAGDWTASGRVFTYDDGRQLDPAAVRRAWRSILKASGVVAVGAGGRGRGLHELRRTFATRLRTLGVGVEEVQRLGRWTSPAMLLRLYRAVDDQQLRSAAGTGDEGQSW